MLPSTPLQRAFIQRSELRPDHCSILCVHRLDLVALLAYATAYSQDHPGEPGQYAAMMADKLRQLLLATSPGPDDVATVYDAILDPK